HIFTNQMNTLSIRFIYQSVGKDKKNSHKLKSDVYELKKYAVNRSITLSILSEQCDILDAFTVVKLPDDLCDQRILNHVNEILSDSKNEHKIINSITSVLDYDKYFNLLRFLRFIDIDNFIGSVKQHIKNVLCDKKYNNKYLYDLLTSSVSDVFYNFNTTDCM